MSYSAAVAAPIRVCLVDLAGLMVSRLGFGWVTGNLMSELLVLVEVDDLADKELGAMVIWTFNSVLSIAIWRFSEMQKAEIKNG